MNEETVARPKSGTRALLIILIVVILLAIGVGGWYFFLKKSVEGGTCNSDTKCETGLTCANKVCSSGAAGSSCDNKDSCKTDYCVNNKCTEGKRGDSCSVKTDCAASYCVSGKCTEGIAGDVCSAHKDCGSGLYCKTGACATPPDYSKYFDKVVISKMKPGLPPGPSNPITVTNTFATTDSIEIDFSGVKETTVGDFYFDVVDSNTGELAMSLKNQGGIQQFSGQNRGVGTDLNHVPAGTYDLNIYFKDELVYTSQIIVTE